MTKEIPSEIDIRPPGLERRRHQRVKVGASGRCMLPDRSEHPCRTLDLSPGGAALIAETSPRKGEQVVIYTDIGSLEGRSVRLLDRGFAIALSNTASRREKLADELTAAADREARIAQDDLPAPRLVTPKITDPTKTPSVREQTMKHPSSRALHAYWDLLRAGRAAPERSEIDPGAIRTILGDVMILEVGALHQYTVRLAGTRICSLLGKELKDRRFAEIFAPADWPEIYALLESTANKASKTVASLVGETEDKRMLGLELLLLPLRHHGRIDARILCSLAAHLRPYWATMMPLARLRVRSSRFENPVQKTAATALYGAGGPARNLRVQPPNLRVLDGGRN